METRMKDGCAELLQCVRAARSTHRANDTHLMRRCDLDGDTVKRCLDAMRERNLVVILPETQMPVPDLEAIETWLISKEGLVVTWVAEHPDASDQSIAERFQSAGWTMDEHEVHRIRTAFSYVPGDAPNRFVV